VQAPHEDDPICVAKLFETHLMHSVSSKRVSQHGGAGDLVVVVGSEEHELKPLRPLSPGFVRGVEPKGWSAAVRGLRGAPTTLLAAPRHADLIEYPQSKEGAHGAA
jgi:hypothetical protein